MAKPRKSRGDSESATVDEGIDLFAYIFEDYDSDQENVTLARVEPKEHQGQRTSGYLSDLAPGCDEAFIKNNHGGGRFLIQRRSRQKGHILATRNLEIAGPPKLTMTPPSAGAGDSEVPGAGSVTIDVGGVDVPFTGFGDMGRMKEFMLFVKGLQTAFPTPPDPNTMMLELILKQQHHPPSVMEQLEQLKATTELIGAGGSGGGETGATFNDLLKTVVEQAGKIISTGGGPGGAPGAGPGRTLVTSPVTRMAGPTEVTDITGGRDAAERQKPTEPTGVAMSERELLMMVVGQIVGCFRLSPPKPAVDVVPMIDQILARKGETERLQIISNYSGIAKSFCQTELVNDWNDPDCGIGSQAEFDDYFQGIFTEYGRSDREVILI